jgi:UDPglucose 6-dehydrogenase
MNVSVIGTGHVGLVAGLCFAEVGHKVVCLDSDQEKIARLKEGRPPFYEPHVAELLRRNLEQGQIVFTNELEETVNHSEVIFLCLGTPPLPGGEADLSTVERVSRHIATLSQGYKLMVEKSTVPVLTGDRISKTMQIYRNRQGDTEFDVASNPEFLSEGSAVVDFLYPDRIVVGAETKRAENLLREVYEPIIHQDFPWNLEQESPRTGRAVPLLVTNRRSAELIKHASNSFLAMKISYINAVANLCEAVGADIQEVSRGMGADHRIGPQFLNAGIGFGGFCFPKDLQAFIQIAEKSGCDFRLLREVERLNTQQIDNFVRKVKNELWVLKNKSIAVWGLAFKPNTDDLRFSPAVTVVQRLLEERARVRAYDPRAMEEAKRFLPVEFCLSAVQAAKGADALLILTEWPEFAEVDLRAVGDAMLRPLIFDGRNLLEGDRAREAGFEYISVGRS